MQMLQMFESLSRLLQQACKRRDNPRPTNCFIHLTHPWGVFDRFPAVSSISFRFSSPQSATNPQRLARSSCRRSRPISRARVASVSSARLARTADRNLGGVRSQAGVASNSCVVIILALGLLVF